MAGPAEAASPAITERSGRLEDAIDALLPQTQCTKCGFEGCRPYAEAIAAGSTAINRCPPGGAAGIARLARLLGRAELPLDPDCGVEAPRRLAWIDPGLCIGCTKCIQACPVDAIIGAQRRMHTVAAALCTGCELCVAPCPVDCIVMRPLDDEEEAPRWSDADADAARARHLARRARLARVQARRRARLAARAPRAPDALDTPEALDTSHTLDTPDTLGSPDAFRPPGALGTPRTPDALGATDALGARSATAGTPASAGLAEQSAQSSRRAVIEAAMRRARERLAAAAAARPVPPQ